MLSLLSFCYGYHEYARCDIAYASHRRSTTSDQIRTTRISQEVYPSFSYTGMSSYCLFFWSIDGQRKHPFGNITMTVIRMILSVRKSFLPFYYQRYQWIQTHRTHPWNWRLLSRQTNISPIKPIHANTSYSTILAKEMICHWSNI